MAARDVARARLAFNWEVTEYDRPSYGHYIWYSNITNNSVKATFPCAEIKAGPVPSGSRADMCFGRYV